MAGKTCSLAAKLMQEVKKNASYFNKYSFFIDFKMIVGGVLVV